MWTALIFRFQQVDPFVSKSITSLSDISFRTQFAHVMATQKAQNVCLHMNYCPLLVSHICYYNFCYLQHSRVSKLFRSPARRVSSFDFYVVAFLKFLDSVSFLEKTFRKSMCDSLILRYSWFWSGFFRNFITFLVTVGLSSDRLLSYKRLFENLQSSCRNMNLYARNLCSYLSLVNFSNCIKCIQNNKISCKNIQVKVWLLRKCSVFC